jgi:hypothetical protein
MQEMITKCDICLKAIDHIVDDSIELKGKLYTNNMRVLGDGQERAEKEIITYKDICYECSKSLWNAIKLLQKVRREKNGNAQE